MAKVLSLMAVGDIFIGTPSDYPHISHASPITTERSDLFSWLEKIALVLQEGAFTMGNLEGPICEGGQADAVKLATGGGIIRMPPEAAHAMRRNGYSNNIQRDSSFWCYKMLHTFVELWLVERVSAK